MTKLKPFFIAFALFIVLDFLWLGFIMKDFNMHQLADIGRIENGVFELNYPPAFVTYILMALAIPLYVLPKFTKEAPVWKMFFHGALLGLIVYGVFDTTNLAILKNYPLAFALVDMSWGTFAFGAVTVITAKLSR